MISPDIKDLMRNMDSRYTLVVTAAKRARQLTAGAEPLTKFRSDKPVTLAIHEIAEGKVDYFRDAAVTRSYIDGDGGRGENGAGRSIERYNNADSVGAYSYDDEDDDVSAADADDYEAAHDNESDDEDGGEGDDNAGYPQDED